MDSINVHCKIVLLGTISQFMMIALLLAIMTIILVILVIAMAINLAVLVVSIIASIALIGIVLSIMHIAIVMVAIVGIAVSSVNRNCILCHDHVIGDSVHSNSCGSCVLVLCFSLCFTFFSHVSTFKHAIDVDRIMALLEEADKCCDFCWKCLVHLGILLLVLQCNGEKNV